jgi:hypothetical protein
MIKSLISSIAGLLVGALASAAVVNVADSTLFGCKSVVFIPELIGAPLGSAIGYTVSVWSDSRPSGRPLFIAATTFIGSLFSFAFLYAGLLVAERHAGMVFLLQFCGVITVTMILGRALRAVLPPLVRGSDVTIDLNR